MVGSAQTDKQRAPALPEGDTGTWCAYSQGCERDLSVRSLMRCTSIGRRTSPTVTSEG